MSPRAAELYPLEPPLMAFHIELVPPKTSHHAKRIVRIGSVSRLADSPALRSATETWMGALLPFQPTEPFEGPLRLDLTFVWPWRKSDRRATERIPYPCRPDCDNLAKTVADTMAALCFFRDDAQVVDLRVSKWLGSQPGLGVAIWRVA